MCLAVNFFLLDFLQLQYDVCRCDFHKVIFLCILWAFKSVGLYFFHQLWKILSPILFAPFIVSLPSMIKHTSNFFSISMLHSGFLHQYLSCFHQFFCSCHKLLPNTSSNILRTVPPPTQMEPIIQYVKSMYVLFTWLSVMLPFFSLCT